MGSLRYTAIRSIFELAWASRLTGLLRARSKARGLIFTLHRVLPDDPPEFAPNAILQIKPEFLEYTIRRVRELGYDIVGIEEAVRRTEAVEAPARKFVVFTFDDGYRDNLEHALPILREHECPFTLYVPTALVDGAGEIWWQALEDIIAAREAVAVTSGGQSAYHSTATLKEKHQAFATIYQRMRQMPEPERVTLIRHLARQYGFDLAAHCRALIMTWAELKIFANDPLCTIGAHTVHHYELAKLPEFEARNEVTQSISIIKAQFGTEPRHLSYPIGATVSAGEREYAMARELGLRSAVTTLPGAVYPQHRDRLTSLPRISLNGLFQARRYVDVFATPALFPTPQRKATGAPSSG